LIDNFSGGYGIVNISLDLKTNEVIALKRVHVRVGATELAKLVSVGNLFCTCRDDGALTVAEERNQHASSMRARRQCNWLERGVLWWRIRLDCHGVDGSWFFEIDNGSFWAPVE
jgi:hypothetical protein